MDYYVYKFLDKEGNALYVGQTVDVDRRMEEHKGRIWDIEKDHIEFAKCKNLADMNLYEMYYINKLHAKYNDCLVYNVEPSFTLPELDFQIYDGKITEQWHEQTLAEAKRDFNERLNPEKYFTKKIEDLDAIINRCEKESEEYNQAVSKRKEIVEKLKKYSEEEK